MKLHCCPVKKLTVFLVSALLLAVFPVVTFAQISNRATLSLDPSSGTFNAGCDFSINIVLDTAGAQTDGTDAILSYDPSRFLGQSVTNGTIYPDYPGNNIDNSAGRITISGLASVSAPFTGTGILATVNFKVADTAPAGATQIKFEFSPTDKGNTTDSNVVQRGTIVDLLNSVTDGNYIVGTGSCGAPGVTVTPAPGGTVGTLPDTGGTSGGRGAVGLPATSSGEVTPTPIKALPQGGTQELTFAVAIVGGILTVLGILGLALL